MNFDSFVLVVIALFLCNYSGKGPVIIYGWGWARRENISKQKNIFTQPFAKQKYLQPNLLNAGGENLPHPILILLDNIAC